jgi:hypothetical protein
MRPLVVVVEILAEARAQFSDGAVLAQENMLPFTVRQSRSIMMLSKARPRPSMLTRIPFPFKRRIHSALVGCLGRCCESPAAVVTTKPVSSALPQKALSVELDTSQPST